MFWGILLLLLGLWSVAAAANALRPFRQEWLLFPSLVWSWMVIGLPGQHVLAQMVLAGVLVWWGALEHLTGWMGLALLLVAWVGIAILLARTRRSRRVVDDALDAAGIARFGDGVRPWRILLAFPFRGRHVEKITNIEFRRVGGHVLKLDVYRKRGRASGRPVLLYIHGGGWIAGDKREQGLPLLHHMARNGWVCFTANYRLSPGATFPDPLVDVKAAVVWIRDHGETYGADPSFIAVAGGSAGGHLAALAGLTEGDARYQPGFETADASVQATVAIYGIYDLTDRMGAQADPFVPMLMEPIVMKAFLDDEPETYREASPIDRIHPDIQPFLVAQGDRDTLAPVVETRAFVDRLQQASSSRVVYIEFPGAQHIFDLGYSYQSAQMIEGVLAFLHDELSRSETAGASDRTG